MVILIAYGLAFIRAIVGITFLISFATKVASFKSFTQTINTFNLLPSALSFPLAIGFVAAEMLIVLLMLAGGSLLSWGFFAATLLISIFTVALASVLKRNIQTSCNCFGTTDKLITSLDIQRNLGLLALACMGLVIGGGHGQSYSIGLIEWGFIGLISCVIAVVWINLGDILKLLTQ